MGVLSQLLDFRAVLFLALVMVPLERLNPIRPAQPVLRDQWRLDLVYLFVNRVFIQAGVLGIVALAGIAAHRLVPEAFRVAVATQATWVQFVEALVLADLCFYAVHRLFHAVPFLWRFHVIHHSLREMDWLAAARVHPIDQILTKGLSIVPLYVFGFSKPALAAFAILYFWQSVLIHSNFRMPVGPLRWILSTPQFHHWHHADQPEAYNRNYAGQLPIIDLVFGTLHMPRDRMPDRYGVPDPLPDGYVAQLRWPFRRPAGP